MIIEGKITITKEEYFKLRVADMTLDLLNAGGVDNWEWYGESLSPEGGKEFDEKEKELREEIIALTEKKHD